MASIIAGPGEASGGRYACVAPAARPLNGKVREDFGRGPDSWIIAGMQWAAKLAASSNDGPQLAVASGTARR